MAKRPALNETDEDTLKLQEEFLLEKGKDGLLKSIKENQTNEEEKEDFSLQVLDAFEAIPVDHSLKIYERREGGEPPPKHYKEQRRKGTSIFSQRMQKATKPKDDEPMEVTESACSQQKSSTIISMELPENENDQIHQENVKVMQEMTEEEILEERQRLMDTMDPAIANFLKSKRKVNQESSTVEIGKQNEAARNVNIDDLEAPNEVMELPGAEKWLNFDQVEVGKLAWMSKMDIPQLKESSEYNARFDFKGFILPFTLPEINESNRSLYHHGDEPGRPGYTLQELFQLCRSSISQQRVVALDTIANILSVYQYGIYDDAIDIPFEQIFFMLRISLDDNAPAVLNASVKAMRNLFFYAIDEACLDNLLGYGLGTVQPILAVDDETDDNRVNDQQLAEANLVKCLMRTNIFNRMRYIVNTLKPTTETIVYCIEILIRLARDSNFVIQMMLDCKDLLDGIVKYFACPIKTSRKTSDYEYPLVHAVKLFRILVCRSYKFTVELVNRHKIMDSVASYLTNEDSSNMSLELQNEAIHLWSFLLMQNLALDYFRQLEGTILKNFHHQVDYTALQTTFTNQKHISAVTKLIAIGLNKNLFSSTNKEQVTVILRRATEKWTAQFCNLDSFSCGLLQINSSLFKLCGLEDNLVLSLLKSKGFRNVTKSIRAGSNFLSHFKCHKSSSNLKCIEAAVWEGKDHIIPVLCSQSCIPFLRVLSEVVANSTSNEVKLQFLNHPNVEKYLNHLNAMESFNLTNNWFTKLETQLIINILKSSVAVQNSIDTSVFYEIAVKCLSTFNYEQNCDIEFIFRHIIFSTKFYPCSALLKNLDVTDDNNLLEKALVNLDNIFNVYMKVLNIKTDDEVEFAVNAIEGNVIPVDWIYSPIVLLYSNNQGDGAKLKEENQFFITKNCLYWIYIYETYFPKLASLIDPTDRFCRLACTFLVSDLFLNPEIRDLLVAGFKNLLKSIDKINFDKPIQGLSSFQDFYIQLLEHYQAVSCRDILFGNFILLPLMQKYNKVYRETLWSEYIGVVEVFNVGQEQVMSPIEMYLNPHEDNTKLLKCYKIALMKKLHPNSFLHQIAMHHIKEYMISKRVGLPPFLNKNINQGT